MILFAARPAVADQGLASLPASSTAEALHKQREKVAEEISRLTSAVKSGDDQNSANETQLGLLRSLDAIYARHEGWLDEQSNLEVRLPREQKNLEHLDSYTPNEPKPYSFLLLDRLKDEQEIEQARQRTAKSNVTQTEQRLQAAREELKAADQQATEKTPALQHALAAASEGNATLATEGLPLLIARANAAATEAERDVRSLQLSLLEVKGKQLAKKIDVIAQDSSFSPADLAQQSAAIEAKAADLRQKLNAVGEGIRELETTRAKEDARLVASGAAKVVQQSAADSWRAIGVLYRAQAAILGSRLGILQKLQQIWKHRYELANKKVERETLLEWRAEVDALTERIDDERHALDQQRDSAHDDLAALDQAREEQGAVWQDLLRRELRATLELTEAGLPELTANERICKRFQGELSEQLATPADGFENFGHALLSLVGWKVADSEGHAVTAGQLLMLILCIIAGVICAYYASRWIGRRVMAHFGVSRGKAVAIRSIVFYVLCLVAGTIAFRLLDIPLAAFAFLGGAAAIAIGFGSQDIMNNFMSGLILLAEQPIRVGDVIDLGTAEGTVTHIGMRSTRVRTLSNHELIVPNKNLLDEQVTNFTLSNDVVRRSVTMTLERSIPVAEAKKKMLRVARSHPLVLKTPRPVVLVKEVDNYYETVTFEVYFAMHLNSFMQCATVQSRILERIATLFPGAKAATTSPAATGDVEAESRPAAEDVPPSGETELENGMILKELKRMRRRMQHHN